MTGVIIEEVAKGYELDQACFNVTKEIGHERIDVIDIYLGGYVKRLID